MSDDSRSAVHRRAATLFVLAVWLAMLASDFAFVARNAPDVRFLDDLALAAKYDAREPITAAWLWEPYNVHRIPIANFVLAELVRHTSEFRTGMYATVALVGTVSLGMILAARKIRGRTSFADAFFPLVWLHWGNAENFLIGFQFSVLLPPAIVATALMALVTCAGRLDGKHLAVIGACMLLLPFNGGHGLTQTPPWVAWLAWIGRDLGRGSDARDRRIGSWMHAIAIATIALVVIYLVGIRFPRGPTTTSSPFAIARGVVNFVSLSIGPATIDLAPWSTLFVLALFAATAWLLVRVARDHPDERARAAGVLACMLGIVTMAVCVGWGRTSDWKFVGIALRYVGLPTNLACCAYFAWGVYGSPAIGRVAQYGLCALMAALLPVHVWIGQDYAYTRTHTAADFVRDVDAGLSVSSLAIQHQDTFGYGPAELEPLLRYLDEARWAPFDRRPAEVPFVLDAQHPYRMMPARPIAASSPHPIVPVAHLGDGVLIVRPPGELRFAIPDDARTLRCGFGIHLEAYKRSEDSAVRFSAEIEDAGAPAIQLFERTLEPACNGPDRGVQRVTIALPPGSHGELVLRTAHVPGHDPERSWSFWTGVAIE